MTEEQIFEKIRKLLALSASPNENEAQLAAMRVQEILAKHNLSLEDMPSEESDDLRIIDEAAEESETSCPQWKIQLASTLARNFGCKCYTTQFPVEGRKNYARRIQMVGAANDVRAVKLLFEYLSETIIRLAKYRKGSGRGWIAQYKLGLVEGISNKLYEQRKANREEIEIHSTEAGRELVRVKGARLKEYLSKHYNFARSYSRSRYGEGRAEGRADGGNISLNKQVGSRGNKLLSS